MNWLTHWIIPDALDVFPHHAVYPELWWWGWRLRLALQLLRNAFLAMGVGLTGEGREW